MAGVRAMLARVQRLEHSRSPVSPFESAFGSLADWEEECQSGINEGRLDARDIPVVIAAIRRWHSEGLWC